MQIHSINSNLNSQKQTFSGGISYNVLSKIMKNGGDLKSAVDKASKIQCINNPNYIITDVVYNAQNKCAEFFLSVCDLMKFTPGMENIQSKKIVSKGNSLSEAFLNIDTQELKTANKALEDSYNKQLIETETYREKVYKNREKNLKYLIDRFENARSFWIDYYRHNY